MVAQPVATNIQKPEDLYGKSVVTGNMYQQVLNKFYYGLDPKNITIRSDSDVNDALRQVQDGTFDAMIYNLPLLISGFDTLTKEHVHSDTCLLLVSWDVLPRYNAFAFAWDFNKSYVEAISFAMAHFDDDGRIADMREPAWGTKAQQGMLSTCALPHSGAQQLGLKDMYSLFIILGSCGLVAVLISSCPVRRGRRVVKLTPYQGRGGVHLDGPFPTCPSAKQLMLSCSVSASSASGSFPTPSGSMLGGTANV